MIKAKVCIKSLCIKDIPERSNRIFLKVKSGKNSFVTPKYCISNDNTVNFENMIFIPCDFKKAKNGKRLTKIRFSFRFEKSNGIDFTRYGSFDIIDFDYDEVKSQAYHVLRNLDKCKEKPQIECEMIVIDNLQQPIKESKLKNSNENPQTQIFQNDNSDQVLVQNSLKTPSLSQRSTKSDPCNHQQIVQSDVEKLRNSCFVSSYSYSRSFTKSTPIKITEEKYREIENKIDNLLAEIINDNSFE